jgi:hypothetical protein
MHSHGYLKVKGMCANMTAKERKMRKDMQKTSKSPTKESKNFFSQMYDRFAEIGGKGDDKRDEVSYATYQ